jgi:glycosyltransferase involved in cell wall biosynthesis
MRILIVSDAWYPQVNGVVRALDTTARHAETLGHEVTVLGPDRFRTVPLPTYNEIRLALCSRRSVGRIIERAAPDAVHIATEGPLGWAARSWMKSRGLPFTTSFHTMFPLYVRVRTGIPESVSFAVVRHFHEAGVRTLVSTPTLESLLRSKGFTKVARWPRGVDTELFRPVEAVRLEGEGPILMYVGRIAVEKNLEAFLSLDVPGTKYMVGDGPQRAELERNFPEAQFTGVKHGDELVAHFCAADAFVFPSLTDTLGLVMLEALGCGVPVAGYPVQGPLDVVADSGAGALHEDLAEAVHGALRVDRSLCRPRALEFSWSTSARIFVEMLEPFSKEYAESA